MTSLLASIFDAIPSLNNKDLQPLTRVGTIIRGADDDRALSSNDYHRHLYPRSLIEHLVYPIRDQLRWVDCCGRPDLILHVPDLRR
jgi:hypothetical protein